MLSSSFLKLSCSVAITALALTACSTAGEQPEVAVNLDNEPVQQEVPIVSVKKHEDKVSPKIETPPVEETEDLAEIEIEPQAAETAMAANVNVPAQPPVMPISTPVAYRQTVVGKKIAQLMNDHQRIQEFTTYYDGQIESLQKQSQNNATAYYSLIAAINCESNCNKRICCLLPS